MADARAEQSARQVAHLLGDMRQCAERDGGEIGRTTYYQALIRHGLLAEEEDLAFTDAPDAIFDALDADMNGSLSIDELEAGVKGLVADEFSLQKVNELLALGNDVMRTSMRQMAEKLSGQAARVIDLFKKWDRDGDGSISKVEFRKAMPMLGITGHTQAEVDALFESFDPDGSGEITFRELYKMLRHNPNNYGQAEAKPRAEVQPAEQLVDLTQLRQKMKLDMFKMEVQNEVLWYTRSRPGRAANNPTISGTVNFS